MHLSRLKTKANCALTFMGFSLLGADAVWIALRFALGSERAFQPVHVLVRDLVQGHHRVALATDRSVIIEAVRQLRIAADHVGRLDKHTGDGVEYPAALAGGRRARHVDVRR